MAIISSLLRLLEGLPAGGYTTEELGLNVVFPKIRMIYFDKCPQKHGLGLRAGVLAHTHKVLNDRMYNCVCFAEGTPLWEQKNGKLDFSDTLWHEYGHVLDSGHDPKKICEMSNEQVQELGHGPSWRKIMRNLGKGQLATYYTWKDNGQFVAVEGNLIWNSEL